MWLYNYKGLHSTNQFNDLLPVGFFVQCGRALHQYRRGQRFESRTSLNLFQAHFFRNCKSSFYNYDDHLSHNSSPHSSHIWFSYIYNFNKKIIAQGICQKFLRANPPPAPHHFLIVYPLGWWRLGVEWLVMTLLCTWLFTYMYCKHLHVCKKP